MPVAMVASRANKLKACLAIECAVPPPVYRLSTKQVFDSLAYAQSEYIPQPVACPIPFRARGLNQQQAQFCDALTGLHDKDGTNDFTIHLGDPAALTLRVVVIDKVGDNLCYQRSKCSSQPYSSA